MRCTPLRGIHTLGLLTVLLVPQNTDGELEVEGGLKWWCLRSVCPSESHNSSSWPAAPPTPKPVVLALVPRQHFRHHLIRGCQERLCCSHCKNRKRAPHFFNLHFSYLNIHYFLNNFFFKILFIDVSPGWCISVDWVPVRFPLKAHALAVGQVPRWGRETGNQLLFLSHILFLSLSFSVLYPLSKNKSSL